MKYFDFKGSKISRLGFGMMRLPKIAGTEQLDEAEVEKMVDAAMAAGINYYDTAYPYHEGKSEIVTGKLLAKYPRDSWYIADKFPGHQLHMDLTPQPLFEEQLKKCGVDYFDFYLLHNVTEFSMSNYLNPEWNILDYLIEQKKNGRIRHLGFSSHGNLESIRQIIDRCHGEMEFCQIQMNYVDWDFQDAKSKVELLKKNGLAVWVMEPVRGGMLANPAEEHAEALRKVSDEGYARQAFRWLLGHDELGVILSGMSSMEQLEDNIDIFSNCEAYNEEQNKLMEEAAKIFVKNSVPCTGCGYCKKECPQSINIPYVISLYNDMRIRPTFNITTRVDAMAEGSKPKDCLGCGACTHMCPQNIDIPGVMKDFDRIINQEDSWDVICRRRAAAAANNKQ